MADEAQKGTGPESASNAGRLLGDPESPEDVKDVAASDLAQVERRPEKD